MVTLKITCFLILLQCAINVDFPNHNHKGVGHPLWSDAVFLPELALYDRFFEPSVIMLLPCVLLITALEGLLLVYLVRVGCELRFRFRSRKDTMRT